MNNLAALVLLCREVWGVDFTPGGASSAPWGAQEAKMQGFEQRGLKDTEEDFKRRKMRRDGAAIACWRLASHPCS
jgi:hypothetical protein